MQSMSRIHSTTRGICCCVPGWLGRTAVSGLLGEVLPIPNLPLLPRPSFRIRKDIFPRKQIRDMLQRNIRLWWCAAVVVRTSSQHDALLMDDSQRILAASMGANCTPFTEIPRAGTQEGDVQFDGDLSIHPEAPSIRRSTAKGATNFRYMMEILLGDGSTHISAGFFDQAKLEICDDEIVKGIWSNVDDQGLTVSSIAFETRGQTLAEAHFAVDLPDIKGKLDLRTRTTPIFASGKTYPPTEAKDEDVANAVLAPGMWWEIPIPAADAHADIQLSGKEHLTFSGRGGHDRIWRYQVTNLQLDGKVVFSSRSDDVSTTDDYAVTRSSLGFLPTLGFRRKEPNLRRRSRKGRCTGHGELPSPRRAGRCHRQADLAKDDPWAVCQKDGDAHAPSKP
nr:cytochalasin biosynthesis protein f [Quercus suber]